MVQLMSDRAEYTGAPQIGPKLNTSMGYNINAPAEAFGSGLFQAIHGLGQVGEEAALKKQALVNDIDHNNLALDTSQKFSDEWTNMGTRKGLAAQQYYPTFQKNIRDIYNKAVEGAPNPAVQKQLASTMFRDADRYNSYGARHVDSELNTANKDMHARAMDDTVNQIELHRKQPISEIEHWMEDGYNGIGGVRSVREHLFTDGYDPTKNPEMFDARERMFRGAATAPLVKALIEDGDVAGAQRVFKHFEDKMDAKSRNVIDGMLQPKLKEKWVNDTANELRPIPNPGGYNPTIAAQAFKDGLMSVPTRANAATLGLRPSTAIAIGDKHASDYFAHLERGNGGVGYVQTNDTHGSHSYGSNGLNTWTRGGDISGTSAGRFWKQYGEKLGLTGVPGTSEADASWKAVAAKNTVGLRAAEREWWTKENYDPVQPKLTSFGAPASIANDPAVKLYFADRNIQQGSGAMDNHKDRIAHALTMSSGNPALFIRSMNEQDAAHINGDFHTFLDGIERQSGTAARARAAEGLVNRITGRHEAAEKAAAEGGSPAAPQPQAQPESPYLTTSAVKQQRRASNLEIAEQRSGGDPEKRNALFSELNKRDVLIQSSVSGRHQQIEFSAKMLEMEAQKGIPGLTLEKFHLSDQMVREAFPADKQWRAEHILESAKYKIEEANKLYSLRFAPKADVDAHFVETQSGSGVGSFLENHRRKEGTTGAFAMGADPDAPIADMGHRFDLHEQAKALNNSWYTERKKILDENAAQWVSKEPNVVAKANALKEAEESRDPERKRNAFNEYASASIAVQRQMGVPEEKIHALTAQTAQSWTDHIMKSDDPKGEMMAMEHIYGQHQWNQISHDMVTVGGMPAKLEGIQYLDNYNAQVLSNMVKNENYKESGKDGKKEHRMYEDMIVPTSDGHPGKRAIDDAISKDPTMENFKESLVRRGMLSQVNEIQDAVRSLAYGRAAGAGGRGREDHGTAAKEAVKAFVAEHEFTSDNAMIPKANAEEIKNNMKFVRESLTNQITDIPGWLAKSPGWTVEGKSKGLPDQREYLERSKNLGSWANTFNGDGVEYRDEYGKTMHYADGKPVRIMFNDMSDVKSRMRSRQYFAGNEGHTRYQEPEPAPYAGYSDAR